MSIHDDSKAPGPHDWASMPDPYGTDGDPNITFERCNKCKRMADLSGQSGPLRTCMRCEREQTEVP